MISYDNNEVNYVDYKISDVDVDDDDDDVIMTSWPSYHRNARSRKRLYFCIDFFNFNYKGKAMWHYHDDGVHRELSECRWCLVNRCEGH